MPSGPPGPTTTPLDRAGRGLQVDGDLHRLAVGRRRDDERLGVVAGEREAELVVLADGDVGEQPRAVLARGRRLDRLGPAHPGLARRSGGARSGPATASRRGTARRRPSARPAPARPRRRGGAPRSRGISVTATPLGSPPSAAFTLPPITVRVGRSPPPAWGGPCLAGRGDLLGDHGGQRVGRAVTVGVDELVARRVRHAVAVGVDERGDLGLLGLVVAVRPPQEPGARARRPRCRR